MFSMCSELTPRAPVPDNRTPQLMQPCTGLDLNTTLCLYKKQQKLQEISCILYTCLHALQGPFAFAKKVFNRSSYILSE